VIRSIAILLSSSVAAYSGVFATATSVSRAQALCRKLMTTLVPDFSLAIVSSKSRTLDNNSVQSLDNIADFQTGLRRGTVWKHVFADDYSEPTDKAEPR
jgi:hypothetical protein